MMDRRDITLSYPKHEKMDLRMEIVSQFLKEGRQEVKKGDLLVTIETVTDEMLAEKEAAIAKNKEDTDAVLASFRKSTRSGFLTWVSQRSTR